MTRINSKMSSVVAQANATIQAESLLQQGDCVVVGLSGGADSVALLLVLMELREEYGFTITCAHVNHKLRGEASVRDMEFVVELCKRLQLPISVLEEDAERFAKEHRLSIEDAGRQIRYRFFAEQGADKIATAHTKDDNAETVIMNLVKGNLPKGILPKRGNIIRPLLGISKEELYRYLEEKQQPFVTDETNFSPDYVRNRIRLEVIPYIKEHFNTNFTNTIYHTSCILREEESYFLELCEEFFGKYASVMQDSVCLEMKPLMKLHSALGKKILRYTYFQTTGGTGRISYEEIERIWRLCHKGKSGQRVQLSQSWEVVRCSDRLVFQTVAKPKEFCFSLTENATCQLPSGMTVYLAKQPETECSYCYPVTVFSGATVCIRNRKPGDTLYFKNLNIHKKLSDFLIDKKIPQTCRDDIPLVTVDGEIRVVVGHFYEETDKNSEYIYHIVVK